MSVRQRVLVTGGTGFIGRRVVKRLLEAGLDVTSFGLAWEQSDPSWGRPVRIEYGDLRNIEDVVRAARDTQLIIHLAAVVGVPGDYNMQWQVIAEGTRLVCEVAGALNARVVVASSIAVYGDLIQRQVCREDSGFGPWQGAYGRAKQGQETIARYVCQAFNIPPRHSLRQRRVWTPWFLQVLFQFVWQDQLGAVVCPASGAAFQRLRATMVCAIRFISFQRALMHLPLL